MFLLFRSLLLILLKEDVHKAAFFALEENALDLILLLLERPVFNTFICFNS